MEEKVTDVTDKLKLAHCPDCEAIALMSVDTFSIVGHNRITIYTF